MKISRPIDDEADDGTGVRPPPLPGMLPKRRRLITKKGNAKQDATATTEAVVPPVLHGSEHGVRRAAELWDHGVPTAPIWEHDWKQDPVPSPVDNAMKDPDWAPDDGIVHAEYIEQVLFSLRLMLGDDDGMHWDDGHNPVHEAYMVNKKCTERTRAKQDGKGIAWVRIADHEKPAYQAAEDKQWAARLQHDAVRVMGIEESMQLEDTIDPARILPSRFAYRDKNSGLRTAGSEFAGLPLKAKARLCVGGHLDPDLPSRALRTDAPTVGRLALNLFIVVCRMLDWMPETADVEAAFLKGLECPRGLYGSFARSRKVCLVSSPVQDNGGPECQESFLGWCTSTSTIRRYVSGSHVLILVGSYWMTQEAA